MARRHGPSRLVSAAQGGSYVAFAGWLFARPRQYRRTHRLRTDDWVLRAHGTWMAVTGSALLVAAIRGTASEPEMRLLGLGSAVGLAANDAVGLVRRDVAEIYRSDLAWESALALLWTLAHLHRSRNARRLR